MKRVLMVLTMMSVLATTVLAQTEGVFVWGNGEGTPPVLGYGPKRMSTAGLLGNDADSLHASFVFFLDRRFVSVGYVPIAGFQTPNIPFGAGNMKASFGTPLGGMYLGVTAAYQLNYKTKDTGIPTDNKNTLENSSFNARVVLKIADMFALHLSGGRNGDTKDTTDVPEPVLPNGDTKVIDDQSDWQTELGFAIRFGSMKVYVPVGMFFLNDKNETLLPEANKRWTDNSRMNLYVAPEFTIGELALGKMTQFVVKARFNMDVSDKQGATDADPKPTYADDRSNIGFGISLVPTFAWQLAGDAVELRVEPELRYDIQMWNDNRQNADTDVYRAWKRHTAALKVPVGTTFKVNDWFEVRGGVHYSINYEITDSETKPGAADSMYSTTRDFKSRSDVLLGLGFNAGEDFFFDVLATVVLNNNFHNIFDGGSVGAQMTYRF